jgi:CheY-like chemotaxis protein
MITERTAPILIVEDDEAFTDMLRMALEEAGYSVATAVDGSEALQYLRREEPPCLILLDLMMPGVDGVAFRREQRWDPERGQIPVVVLTALRPDPERLSALAPAAYLTKPFELRELIEVVERLCGDSRPE